jgi:hypothetical protein
MSIRIDGKIPEGYVLLCETKQTLHCFVVKNLGPAIECPKCGATDLSTKLVREFYRDLARETKESRENARPAEFG